LGGEKVIWGQQWSHEMPREAIEKPAVPPLQGKIAKCKSHVMALMAHRNLDIAVVYSCMLIQCHEGSSLELIYISLSRVKLGNTKNDAKRKLSR
jgi:hypothetical protein